MTPNDENIHPNVTVRHLQHSPLDESVYQELLENSMNLGSEGFDRLQSEIDLRTFTPETLAYYQERNTTRKKSKKHLPCYLYYLY
jgi:hypothetical protein